MKIKPTLDIKLVEGQYFYLFANCIPVRGYTRTMICDLQRGKMMFVDNSYYDLLRELASHRISEVIEMLDDEEDIVEFRKFLQYCVNRELGTFVDDIDLFPGLDTSWNHPSAIVNSLIDIRDELHDFNKIFSELDELSCYYIQIRFYRTTTIDTIKNILAHTKDKGFRSVHILVPYEEYETGIEALKAVTNEYPLAFFVIHGTPEHYLQEIEPDSFRIGVTYIRQRIESCHACGTITEQSLVVPSIAGFMENVHFNGCLNRKIAVDERGEIKNCPSMKIGYGNIRENSLTETVKNENFRKLWHISKDQISTCKDCEFRRICTDCRAYTQDNGNLYSKPAKCKYNPYTGQWAN